MEQPLAHRICPSCKVQTLEDDRSCPSCGEPLAADAMIAGEITGDITGDKDPYLGRIISGRYRIEALLGAGASGRVYRVTQTALNKSFALKILHPRFTGDPDYHARFANEAHNTARLNHPNVVSVVDYGRTPDGITFLAMEYVEGRSLEAVIHDEHPLARGRVVDITLQILAALTEAHELNIIHRDLKTENILIQSLRTRGELVKVLDFGIAKLMDSTGPTSGAGGERPGLTLNGVVCGTPEYMSPEQARGLPLDGRSDLYAVGVVLYQLLTGQVPFEAESAVEVLHKHLHQSPTPPSQLTAGISPALEAVCLRALAKDREERFRDAADFREALITANQAGGVLAVQRCSACSGELRPEDRFCPHCGAPNARGPKPGMRRRNSRLSHFSLRSQSTPGTDELTIRTFPLPLVGRPLLDTARVRLASPPSGLHTQVLAGPTGIGKTRLLDELSTIAEECGWRIFATAAEPSGAAPSLWPIRRIVAQILGLELDSPLQTEDLGRAANLIGLSFEALPGLAELFALDGPAHKAEYAVRRRECFASAIQTLCAGGCGRPLLLIFDDIDRYDSASRRVLQQLSHCEVPQPILVLAATSEEETGWLHGPTELLSPLNAEEIYELARNLLSERSPIPELPRLLADQGPSSPLHFELQLRTLVSGMELDLEASDEELLQRRLETLDENNLTVLTAGAVLGERFPERELLPLLQSISLAFDSAVLDECLTNLHIEGLLVVGENGERVFSHRSVRNAAFRASEPELRRKLHAATFSAAASHSSKRMSASIRAMHMLHAGNDSLEDALSQAAMEASRFFDDRKAVHLLNSALKNCSRLPDEAAKEKRSKLQTQLVAPLCHTKRPEEAVTVAQAALSVAEDPSLRRSLARALFQAERFPEASEAIRRAIGPTIAQGDPQEILSTYCEFARSLRKAGLVDEGLKELREGLDMCTLGEGARAEVDLDLWRYLLEFSFLYRAANDRREAKQWCEHALFQAERMNDALGQLRCHAELAQHLVELQQATLAEQHLAYAIELSRNLGDRKTTVELLIARSQLRGSSRSDADARRFLEEAQLLARAIQWREGLLQVQRTLTPPNE